MKKDRPLFDFLNSPLFLLLSGFILTTLVGSYITYRFHEQSWRSKAKFEIFKERFKEATDLQNQILSISNKRLFYLRRINSELNAKHLQSARDIWKEYYDIVQEWNNNVKSRKNKIELVFGSNISIMFLNYEENQSESPKSLHHIFRKSHLSTLAVIECMKNKCPENQEEMKLLESQKRLDHLGLSHDNFAINLIKALKQKELDLLE